MNILRLLPFLLAPVLAYGITCDENLVRRKLISPGFTRGVNGRVAVAFFDADDTLRTSKSRPGQFVDAVDDVEILPGVAAHLRELNRRGMMIVIVSNQGGVPKYRTLRQIDEVLRQTVRQLAEGGAVVHYYDFAERYDEFRKPNLGMVTTLETFLTRHFKTSFVIDRARSFMVGDAAYTPADVRPDGTPGVDRANSDRLFAENLGVRFYRAPEFFAAPLPGTPFAP